MTLDKVEIVRQVIQSFNQRDLDAMTRRFASGVEWEPGGPAAVESQIYRGRDEVSAAFAATWETWDFQVEESEIRDYGDTILWLGNARLKGGASQVEFDQPFAIHFSVQGDEITRFRGFRSWDEALKATGVSE